MAAPKGWFADTAHIDGWLTPVKQSRGWFDVDWLDTTGPGPAQGGFISRFGGLRRMGAVIAGGTSILRQMMQHHH